MTHEEKYRMNSQYACGYDEGCNPSAKRRSFWNSASRGPMYVEGFREGESRYNKFYNIPPPVIEAENEVEETKVVGDVAGTSIDSTTKFMEGEVTGESVGSTGGISIPEEGQAKTIEEVQDN